MITPPVAAEYGLADSALWQQIVAVTVCSTSARPGHCHPTWRAYPLLLPVVMKPLTQIFLKSSDSYVEQILNTKKGNMKTHHNKGLFYFAK